jgi:hypothetical protein
MLQSLSELALTLRQEHAPLEISLFAFLNVYLSAETLPESSSSIWR